MRSIASENRHFFDSVHGLILCLLLFAVPAWGLESIIIEDQLAEIPLTGKLWYLEDAAKQWNLDEVQSSELASSWLLNSQDTPAFGYTNSAYWFRFRAQNPSSDSKHLLLEIAYPLLDSIKVFEVWSNGDVKSWTGGDERPFAQRLVQHRNFLYPLNLDGSTALGVYLCISSSSSLQVPVSLWDAQAYWLHDAAIMQWQSAYYGLMLAMLFYNLFLYFAVRDRAYFFYVAFVASFVGFQLTLHGSGYQYLWPEYPWLNEKAPVLSISATVFFGVLFLVDLLQLKTQAPLLRRYFYWIAAAAFIYGVAALFVPYSSSIMIFVGLSVLVSPFSLATGIFIWRRGYRPARYFTIACGSFLVGAVAFALSKYGFLPRNFFTENGIQLGSALEVVLLSFALADRINIVRQEKEDAEQAREAAEALAQAKGRFLATMSHEIRTPMNGVLGMLELLQGTPLNERQAHYTQTARSSGEHLLGIINDILDFSKIEAGKLKLEWVDFDLEELIESLSASFAENAHQKGLELIVDLPKPEDCRLQGDPLRLRQIIANLLSNAIKFTEQGEIVLKATVKPDKTPQCLLYISIEDTGVGIDAKAQAGIFGTFYQADDSTTRKFGGTGLGLAICQHLVELMGGEIGFDSTPGQGSTFWVKLNLSAQPPGQQALRYEGQLLDLTPLRDRKALFISDNQRQHAVLQDYLALARMQCTAVSKNELRVAQLMKTAGNNAYAAAIFDCNISQPDCGEFMRLVAEELALARFPCVILARVQNPCEQAHSQHRDHRFAMLNKPVRRGALLQKLAEFGRPDTVPSGQAKSGQAMAQPTIKPAKILLVEDNPVNCEIMQAMLGKLGLQVDVAEDGQQAVEAYRNVDYQAILMDCQLPVMDGFQATIAIRNIEQQRGGEPVPIIAITAGVLPEEREHCFTCGMDDYLEKPVKLDRLRDKLMTRIAIKGESKAV